MSVDLRAELVFALAALESVDRELAVLGLTYTTRPDLQAAIERVRKAVSGAVVGAPDSTPAGRSHSPGTESEGKGGAVNPAMDSDTQQGLQNSARHGGSDYPCDSEPDGSGGDGPAPRDTSCERGLRGSAHNPPNYHPPASVAAGGASGWTGKKCPACKGTGEAGDEHSYWRCPSCGGTGDEYASAPAIESFEAWHARECLNVAHSMAPCHTFAGKPGHEGGGTAEGDFYSPWSNAHLALRDSTASERERFAGRSCREVYTEECERSVPPMPHRLGVARAELRTFVSAAAIEEYVAAAIEAREKGRRVA